MTNLLDRETSPYLLQHKDNPVHWRGWSAEALEEAKRQNKPILLSVGYAACHWCHVMAHESFEDQETAAVMNALFINIKVDREERPDIDSIYQSALFALGEQGGWPLTMFLTPDGEPFWGGTYFPKQSAYGRPGFIPLMQEIARLFHEEPEKVEQNRAGLAQNLTNLSTADRRGPINMEAIDALTRHLSEQFDETHGGLRGAPKFPQTFSLELLWRYFLRHGDQEIRNKVINTLIHMCQGGIYDHLGGGFARYSVDEIWLVPHFEKMLYDNALLLDQLCLVWPEVRDEPTGTLFRERIEETIDWVLREMIAGGGRFATTYDADSEGEEGKFYVWSAEEIDTLLGDRADLFRRIYNVTSDGNFEGHTILNRIYSPDLLSPDEELQLAACRTLLLEERNKRIWPGWDDKILTDWNGLMIHALTKASFLFSRPDWLNAAQKAFDVICTRMNSSDHRLAHSWRNGQAKHTGMLDDYANMSRAALALYERTGEDHYLTQSENWISALNKHFWADQYGGYYLTADDAEALVTRTRTCQDNAVPAGNGTMITVLARLSALTGNIAHQRRAEEIVNAFAGDLQRNFFPLTTLMMGYEFLSNPLQLILIGQEGSADCDHLLACLRHHSLPDLLVTVRTETDSLPERHPASGKTRIDGQCTAYLCRGPVCSAPVTRPEDLSALLENG